MWSRAFSSQGVNEILADSRVSFDVINDECVVMTCRAAQKSDQGKYDVTLKNKLGSDTINVNVTVLGRTKSSNSTIDKV